MVHADLQTRAIQDVDIKRFVQNRVRYADLHNTIAEQVKSDVEIKMDEQPGLSRYEVVQEVLKTYSQQRLDAIISKEKKAMRKDWMHKIFLEMRALLLHPGLFIFAIAAAVCYFTNMYFWNSTDIRIPGLILLAFILIFVVYQYFYVYVKNNSGEKKLLQKDTFRTIYDPIESTLLIAPYFILEIVLRGRFYEFLESNLLYSIWFAYICTMLYVMGKVYDQFYIKQLDGPNIQHIPKTN